MIYRISWIENKVTSTGKAKADATLIDNQNIVHDKVTIWGTFPNFSNLHPEQMVEGEITISQNGKYTNKTLRPAMTNTLTPPARKTPDPIAKAMEKKADNIEKAQENKQEGIRQAAIMRDSTLLTSAYAAQREITIEEMQQVWKDWNKFLTNQWEIPFP